MGFPDSYVVDIAFGQAGGGAGSKDGALADANRFYVQVRYPTGALEDTQ
eukprot:COSAG05_NODE_3532_length_2007_cov_8.346436_2_plen_49_part_00